MSITKKKQLLLQDVCARLPYGIMCTDSRHGDSRITEIDIVNETVYCYDFDEYSEIKHIKPYLRSIPNLPEKEQTQLGRLIGTASYNMLKGDYPSLKELLEYVYKNHIDLFGLIPKGLAIEATEEYK